MAINILQTGDIDQVMDLFCECFQEDHYYADIFTDSATRCADMTTKYKPILLSCIERGHCLGVKEDAGKLIAFVICFNYKDTREKDYDLFHKIFAVNDMTDELPYDEVLHKKIMKLDGDTMYLVSIAVGEKYRRRGIASGLIDMIMQKYSKYNIVGDVSNANSLHIYEKRNFSCTQINTGYYYVEHKASVPANTFSIGQSVKVAIPIEGIPNESQVTYSVIKDNIILCGCRSIEDHTVRFFKEDLSAACPAWVVEMNYTEYLKYQRFINIAQYEERLSGDFLYFVQRYEYRCTPLLNDTLKGMVDTRQEEWGLIPDVYVSVPVQYQEKSRFEVQMPEQDARIQHLLRNMDFRTHYESGVPYKQESNDEHAGFKRRIERYYLGKLWIQIANEVTVENYDENWNLEAIGAPAAVDMFISLDKESQCAVLTWYSLSAPFLLSHLMDNVIRNQLMVVVDGNSDKTDNLYDFLDKEYGIIKSGTPKIYVLIPEDKNCLNAGQIASLLSAETIYSEGESFGRIIDKEIIAIADSENGMGLYDRAFEYAYTNVVLQFSPNFRTSLRERIKEESIALFYIELILFEEAAIDIADREIRKLCTSKVTDPVKFREQVDEVFDNFSKTIDFWNIQVNYPTSQKSIDVLRGAFKIQEKLAYLQRDQKQLKDIFDTKVDIIDRNESKRMDTSLAIISILAFVSALMDGHDYISTWSDIFPAVETRFVQFIYFFLIIAIFVWVLVRMSGIKDKLTTIIRKRKRPRKKRHKK